MDADHAKHLVADFEPCRLRTAFLDDSGHIAPERIGQPIILHRRIFSGADLEVDRIDTCRAHG